jgi:SET domain-containing protein
MVTDFIAPNSDGSYSVPSQGLNALDVGFYMNHSSQPNVAVVHDPRYHYTQFVTSRDVAAGEELFIDYDRL